MKIPRTLIIIISSSLIAAVSCSVIRSNSVKIEATNEKSIIQNIFDVIENNQIVISEVIDLKGETIQMPEGAVLIFKGGIIKNGTLVGKKTKIKCNDRAFDRVVIKGVWVVPEISTKLFSSVDNGNSLRDVIALSNPDIHNKIIIESGLYTVGVQNEKEPCIYLNSNTDLILNGDIKIIPNNFRSYDIIKVYGDNITISGSGKIIGERYAHTGDEGEYGIGIDIKQSTNVTIQGLTIKDCWGDCIYVGGNSKNVVIENCWLDHARRNGISITKADGVVIRNSMISNVQGTAPQVAIDVEPNKECSVDHVLIDNVRVKDCEGGIYISKGKYFLDSKRIGEVRIVNCTVSAKSRYPVRIKNAEKVAVERCSIYASSRPAICSSYTQRISICNNKIFVQPNLLLKLKGAHNKDEKNNGFTPIKVLSTGHQIVSGNDIIGM